MTQTIDDFKNLDSLSICTLSDKFEIIPSTVATSNIGIITKLIVFPIKMIANNIIGCRKLADTAFPCCYN